jgi:O-antigen/teichoic acid export membrane protein
MTNSAMPLATHNVATLRQRVLRAGSWTFAHYGISQAIRLGSNLVMTRLLVPEMFGVMAVATMVTVLLNMLSDIGLHQNIVQSRRGEEPAFLDTAWVIQILRGVILWFIALILSIALYFAHQAAVLPANSAYASPILPFVIAVISLQTVISGFQSTKMSTAHRNFDQKRVIQIALISQLAALTVMIASAAMTRSIWALVAGGLVASLTTTALSHSWMSGHRNQVRWDKNALHELIHFGKWIFVSSAVTALVVSGDRLLLGAFVHAEVLGFYAIAVLIVGAIATGLTRLFTRVSLPALSEIARNNPARLRDVYYKMRVPSDVLLLFLTGLLFASGQSLINLLYDPRYAAAGSMLEVLALSLFTVRYGVAHQIYLAAGIPHYLAIVNVARFISLYALVPSLYYLYGLEAAIWAIALHALPTVPLIYCFNARLGLNDFRREVIVLIAMPIGFLCGYPLHLLYG